jgi:hypothetical protein
LREMHRAGARSGPEGRGLKSVTGAGAATGTVTANRDHRSRHGRAPGLDLCQAQNSARPGLPDCSFRLLEPVLSPVSMACPPLHTTDQSPQQGRSGSLNL